MNEHPNDHDDIGYSRRIAGDDVQQVFGIVGSPLALLAGLTAKYAIAEQWSCRSGTGVMLGHLVAVLTLGIAILSAVAAQRQWRQAGREDPEDIGGRPGRTRLMATAGVGVSMISIAVIIAQWLPQFILHPCDR